MHDLPNCCVKMQKMCGMCGKWAGTHGFRGRKGPTHFLKMCVKMCGMRLMFAKSFLTYLKCGPVCYIKTIKQMREGRFSEGFEQG